MIVSHLMMFSFGFMLHVMCVFHYNYPVCISTALYPVLATAFFNSSSETLSSASTMLLFVIKLTETFFTPCTFLKLLSIFPAQEAQCIPDIVILSFFIFAPFHH